MANSFRKDPDAVLDYEIDWSAWLSGDTIATSTWVADTGITVASSTHDTTTTRVWLSGGVDRTDYAVTNHITTTAGRADDRTLTIRVTQGVLTLPVGIQTKTLSIGRPFDALGNFATLKITVTPVFGGTAQRLVWSATGETFEIATVTPPTQSEPDGDTTETINLPIVDQAGWLDGAGNAITGWSYQVSVTPTFTVGSTKTKMKTYTKNVSPLSTHTSPIDMDKLSDGTAANPVLAPGLYVTQVAGVPGAAVSAPDLAAALGDLVMRFIVYGSDASVARPTGTAPVFWIGDPAVVPVHAVDATDFRIPTA